MSNVGVKINVGVWGIPSVIVSYQSHVLPFKKTNDIHDLSNEHDKLY